MNGQEKNDTLWMLEECFKILENWYDNCYKCIRMLTNAVANLTNPLRMKQQQHESVAKVCLYILPVFLFVFYLLGFAQSANSPSY